VRPVGPGETKAGSWAVWADPALVSDAAIWSSNGSPAEPRSAP